MRSVLLVAGDPSGDLHGSHLIRALKTQEPSLRAAAVGGGLIKETADEFLYDLAGLGVTGFLEPLQRLPIFAGLLRSLRRHMRERRPDAVICVDFYGFNRWVLEAAKKEGLRTYYYISPQVWASRPGRAKVIRRIVDKMLVIFPFEEEFYRKEGIPVEFVGHPLLDHLPAPAAERSAQVKPRIGLLPGSRPSEIRRHLDVFLKSLDRIRRQFPTAESLVFAAPQIPDEAYASALRHGAKLVRENDYRLRSSLDIALTSSGTATLENALLGVPMVVVYRLSWPTYAIARSLIRVPYVSMANILAGKRLVPELLQHEATPERISRAAIELCRDPGRMAVLRDELVSLREKLGHPGASARAANAILRGFESGVLAAGGSQR